MLILYFLSIVMISLVVLPLLKFDYWLFRVFDYPRIQKFTIILALCAWWVFIIHDGAAWYEWTMLGLLLICEIHLAYLIYPYTPLGKQMMAKMKPTAQSRCLNVLVANVFQENRKYHLLLQLVERRNPDIVFLLETDAAWLEGVKALRTAYPYSIEVPLENTYGLLFFSKLPLKNKKVNYLVDNEIPSVAADVQLGRHTVKVLGLHPTPPMPQENMKSTDRDAEILMIGKMAKDEQRPCLVMGDLNDVAWSFTTELFLKTSGLLDPRRGRGLFSTFHASYFFLRWPLDHFFMSGHFRLVEMKVENKIGSDHFPISISLLLAEEDDSNKLDATPADEELAEQKIEDAVIG